MEIIIQFHDFDVQARVETTDTSISTARYTDYTRWQDNIYWREL
jgi:hypothetical protein